MKEYTVNETIKFGAGTVLGLNDTQYAARKHALESIKGMKGAFTVLQAVEFKKGEKIGLEADPDKGQEYKLDAADKAEPVEADKKSGKKPEKKITQPAAGQDEELRDLIEMAKEFGIENPESMTKEQLDEAILNGLKD